MLWYDSRVALVFKNLISEFKCLLQEIKMIAFRVFSASRISYVLLSILYFIYVTVTPLGPKIPKERDRASSVTVPQ